jgi:hypothetical protein
MEEKEIGIRRMSRESEKAEKGEGLGLGLGGDGKT